MFSFEGYKNDSVFYGIDKMNNVVVCVLMYVRACIYMHIIYIIALFYTTVLHFLSLFH